MRRCRNQVLSSRTVRYVHTLLNNALKQAVKWQMLRYNPAALTDLPKKTRSRKIQPLTEEQQSQFLNAAEGDRYYTLFVLALTTGLRPEEYLALRWSDVDVKKGSVTVERALIFRKKGKGWYFGEPKTRNARRTVPLTSMALQALKEHKRRQGEEKLLLGARYRKDLDLLFATKEGGPVDPDNLRVRHFKAILPKAELPGTIRLYDLRHSWVTLSLASGVHVKTVSQWAGHASAAFTLDTYAHVIP